MTRYYDNKKGAVNTGSQIARGGEGTVFTVQENNDLAAKIWAKPDDTKAEKITAIIRSRLGASPETAAARCAWPQDLLRNQQGEPAGYLMPKVNTAEFDQSFAYYNKSQREKTEQKQGTNIGQEILVTAGLNLSLAVASVHDAGHVIGDVNEKNVLVNSSGAVVIVDMDSIQVHDQQAVITYLCEVGREDYTPPRMQGKSPRQERRTKDDDCFGLAVLIFKFIMGGMHPFSSVVEPDDQSAVAQLGEKIKQHLFPYNEDSTIPDRYKVAAPQYKAAWDNARDEVKSLFREAFDPFYVKNNPRPSAERWTQALRREVEIIQQGAGASKASNPAASQASQRSRPHILQGAKEENQKEVQGALNHLLDDLKALVLAYARQGVQEKVWSFDELRTNPAHSIASIRSSQNIQQSGDVLALLHILASITRKLDRKWTRERNINPLQIQDVTAIRNNVHNLERFADANYTTRALRSIENLQDGIKAAPRPWPRNAVWKGNQNPRWPNPTSPQQVNRPPTNRPMSPTGPQQTSTGPEWEERIARALKFIIKEHPLSLLFASAGIAIIWFSLRLSDMEGKGKWTLLIILAAFACEWLCKRKSIKGTLRNIPNLVKETWEATSRIKDRKVRRAMQSAIGVTGVGVLGIPILIAVFLATPPGSEPAVGDLQEVAEASTPQMKPTVQPSEPRAEEAVPAPMALTTTSAENGTTAEATPAPSTPASAESETTAEPTPAPSTPASGDEIATRAETAAQAQEAETSEAATRENGFQTFTLPNRPWEVTFLHPTGWTLADNHVARFLSPEGNTTIDFAVHGGYDSTLPLSEIAEKYGERINGKHRWWHQYLETDSRTGENEDYKFYELKFLGQREPGKCLEDGTTRIMRSKYYPEFTHLTWVITGSGCEERNTWTQEKLDKVLSSVNEHNADWDIERELTRRAEARTKKPATPTTSEATSLEPTQKVKPKPTVGPTPVATPTATPTPTPTPAPTPTPTPTPAPTPQASLTLEDDKYAINYGHGWQVADIYSASNSPFYNVRVAHSEESYLGDFYLQYFTEHLDRIRNDYHEPPVGYPFYESTESVGKGYHIRREYRWQTSEVQCLYRVVEHYRRSQYPDADHGFIVTTGVCEDDPDRQDYEREREIMLKSFREK